MITALMVLSMVVSADTAVSGIVRMSVEIFESAQSLTVAPNGDLYCIDRRRNTVYHLSGNGTVLNSIGGQGWGQHEFDAPTDVSSTFLLEVFVTDYNNRRIQRYDRKLHFVQTYDESTLPSSVGRFQPTAGAVSKQGDLFIVEQDGKRILKLNRRNQLESEFGTFKDGIGALEQPVDIAVTPNDEVAVLDRGKIAWYDNFGNVLRAIPLEDRNWKSIHAADGFFVVISSSEILILSAGGSGRRTVTAGNIIGLPKQAEFTDAAIAGEFLYILTGTGLYRCSLH
ncbi:MAG: NHL repeat-containing protein [Bacteroidota bacterium]